MGIAKCPMNEEQFVAHMKAKALTVGAKRTVVGKDYSVFEFSYKYGMQRARDNFCTYADYYGYRIEDDGDTAFVVINKN